MSIPKFLYYSVGGRFRARRQRWLESRFRKCRRVLDIGGMPDTWRKMNRGFADEVILLNVLPQPAACWLPYVQADARALPFGNHAFDLAFSNSVIEHVGDLPRQQEVASEMLRIGGHIYCQTPCRWFPVEPHHLAIFLHWLPATCYTASVHRWLTINGWRRKPPEIIHFLSRCQLQALFPGCQIRVERFMGWPKSFAAWR